MLSIRYNLFALKRQLELKTGRSYSWREIADELGIHKNTMLNFVNNKTNRVDLDILVSLIMFFRKEGLPISFADMFVVDDPSTIDDVTVSITGKVGDS